MIQNRNLQKSVFELFKLYFMHSLKVGLHFSVFYCLTDRKLRPYPKRKNLYRIHIKVRWCRDSILRKKFWKFIPHMHVYSCANLRTPAHNCAHPHTHTEHPCTPAHTRAHLRTPRYTRAHPGTPTHTCTHPTHTHWCPLMPLTW